MDILGESLSDLRATRTSAKWRAYGPDVLPLWVAEMDARPCEPAVAAVRSAMERGDTGYAWPRDLAEAFSAFAARRWGWDVAPGTAVAVADVMIGAEQLIRSSPPGAAVVVSPPAYDAFYGFVESTHRRLVEAPLDAAHRLDPEALDRAFAEAGRGSTYLLSNPQNPTGTVHTAAELAELARIADAHGVLVVSDEIHAPLAHPGVTFTPYLAVPEAAHGITLVSAAKAWNLAGLKAALAIPGPGAVDRLGELHQVVTHGASHLGVIAQVAVYTEGEPWLDQLLDEVVARRTLATGLLQERLPQVEVAPAEATYLAWLDLGGLGLADPCRTFFKQGRVALGRGEQYDRRHGQSWARLNLATSPEVLEEAVRRMAAAVG